ncbi:MAG: serine/threonine-protein kinase [Sandaracinus sp.]
MGEGPAVTDPTLTIEPAARDADAKPAAEAEPVARAERALEQIPDRFEVERTLGAGASAVVVAARDRTLGRRVALKVLDLRRDATERLLREARAVASLDHPSIVRVHEVDVDRGLLVMELLEGGTLEERRARAPLSADETVALGEQLAAALAAAHDAGLLHRDVKPSNVLFDADGRPRLVDFGIALGLGMAGSSAGTSAYAAPEQLRGSPSVASDVYGLGATLFAACTGRRPDERGAERVSAIVARVTRRRPLAALIARMLEADPRRRPGSAREVGDALARLRTGGRPRWAAALAIAVALALVAVPASMGGLAARRARTSQALESARSALRRNDLDAATAAIALADPDAGETVALSVLLDWWRGTSPDALVERIDRALASELPTSDREVLVGLRLLGLHRIDEAAEYFDRVVREEDSGRAEDPRVFPGLALYGAFEAHWHRGEAAAAIALHERIRARDADFALGIEHVLVHHLIRGELERVQAILASSDAVSTDQRVLWTARLALARGEPAAAIAQIRAALAQHPDLTTREYARSIWALAEMMRGDLAAARVVAEACAGVTRALLLHALASRTPDASLETTRRALAAELAAHPTGSYVSVVSWIALELALQERGDLTLALAALERVRRDDVRTRSADLWVAVRRGDAQAVQAARESTSPEVAAMARAFALEARDPAAAARAWEVAADASNDGTFRDHAWLAAARAYARAGDGAQAARACAAIGRGLIGVAAPALRADCDGLLAR